MEIRIHKNERINYIWNTIAGCINAGEAVIVLAVVSRVNGLRDAGIMTLAFSLGNLFMMLGKFGVRNFQVAHQYFDYSFCKFVVARILSTALMTAAAFGYCCYGLAWMGYSWDKTVVIFFVVMWYATEAFEDVFAGKYQVLGKLYIGSVIFSVRWCLVILIFIVVDILTRSIVISAIGAFAVGVIMCCALLVCADQRLKVQATGWESGTIWGLFKDTIPLCISSVAYFYVINLPKYAIDADMSDEIQAIYGYIAMPVFVIGLINSFIFTPQVMNYVIWWREGNIGAMRKKIIKQLGIILVIMLVCFAGAYVLGIPLLELLYDCDLQEYKTHFLLLLLGGGFLAVEEFVNTVLTIINKQRQVMIVYMVTALAGRFVVYRLVGSYALMGAVWGYLIVVIFLAAAFGGMLYNSMRKAKDF